jgi:hypothetical protein
VFEILEFEKANEISNMMKRKIDWLKKPNLKFENSYILTYPFQVSMVDCDH